MSKLSFIFWLCVGLLVACTPQVKISPQPTPEPLFLPTPTANISNTTDSRIEIVVFTPDESMSAKLPPIHIEQDGHAVWVISNHKDSLNTTYHVYETFLSYQELAQIQNRLIAYGFWEDTGNGAIHPGASFLTVWVNVAGQEKSVVVHNSTLIDALREILELSPLKKAYVPEEACLFAQKAAPYMTGFDWPDEQIDFDFSQASQGVFIRGETLLTIWDAILAGQSWIVSQRKPYFYSLKIPQLSCNVTYDGIKNICRLYMTASP